MTPKKSPPTLKAIYRVGELAKLMGVSRKATRTTLTAAGVQVQCSGERHAAFIYLVDLQQVPRFWDSLLAKLGLEAALRGVELVTDDDF